MDLEQSWAGRDITGTYNIITSLHWHHHHLEVASLNSESLYEQCPKQINSELLYCGNLHSMMVWWCRLWGSAAHDSLAKCTDMAHLLALLGCEWLEGWRPARTSTGYSTERTDWQVAMCAHEDRQHRDSLPPAGRSAQLSRDDWSRPLRGAFTTKDQYKGLQLQVGLEEALLVLDVRW